MAEVSEQYNFDENARIMETQPIYPSGNESEKFTACSSSSHHLPNNFPDSYDALNQLIA